MNFENTIIVFDTNVFLNLYRFSPDYANFMLLVMKRIAKNIIVPNTIYCEFKRHNEKLFQSRQESMENLVSDNIDLIKKQKDAINSSFKRFIQGKYPDSDKFLNSIAAKYDEAIDEISNYFSSHSVLSQVKDMWTDDKPSLFIDALFKGGHVLPDLPLSKIYQLCDDGERRFKDKMPPGYKDEKDKKGVRCYSDYFWWWETLEYCKKHRTNLVVVTDDLKEDWWDDSTSSLRKELIDEFKKRTNYRDTNGNRCELNIKGYTAKSFFEDYAKSKRIQIPDAIDYFLNMTDDDYIQSIEDSVFAKIFSQLSYSRDEYVDLKTLDHLGDFEIEDWDVESEEYVEYETCRDNEYIYYYITYHVVMTTQSYDYWGRDDDTKEVIKSEPYDHEVTGDVIVEVKRRADYCLDTHDYDFERVRIFEARFEQTGFRDNNYVGEYDEFANTCPNCGCELTFENDAGNGFCKECSRKEDDEN